MDKELERTIVKTMGIICFVYENAFALMGNLLEKYGESLKNEDN